MVQKGILNEAKKITSDIEYINSTLLLSQGKSWIESQNFENFKKVFSCQNHNHIISEFLFLISNLYSAQEILRDQIIICFYQIILFKFIYNFSLLAENYLNNDLKNHRKFLKF